MKWNLIRTKVIAAMFVSLVLGVVGTVALMQYSFSRNSEALALESVSGAQRLFGILEAREVSKMTSVSDTLALNPQVRDALAAKDRHRLMDLTAPLYSQLDKEGITNWMFHTPEPDMTVFLRLHNPSKFGDHLNRFMDKKAMQTHAIVTGNELAKAGFAVRILRPIFDDHSAVTGYVEFGEELGQFIHAMKKQTGDDYGLLLSKKFMDKQSWADSTAVWKRRNNWDDNPNFVVADKTTGSDSIIQFDGDLSSLPGSGKVLERFQDGDSVFIRGLFPIINAAGETVGAMFVVRDISGFYLKMQKTQAVLISVAVVSLTLGTVLILVLLNSLVFSRLRSIISTATHVVGGGYDSAIKVSSDDEVGQIEMLFEQFRSVFVDVLSHVPELQEKR
jgi:hypothetical protein